jgi:hypothetical protein
MERLAGAESLDTGIGYWFQNLSTNQGMRRKDKLAEKQNGESFNQERQVMVWS